jgi:hypothetical protein
MSESGTDLNFHTTIFPLSDNLHFDNYYSKEIIFQTPK